MGGAGPCSVKVGDRCYLSEVVGAQKSSLYQQAFHIWIGTATRRGMSVALGDERIRIKGNLTNSLSTTLVYAGGLVGPLGRIDPN